MPAAGRGALFRRAGGLGGVGLEEEAIKTGINAASIGMS